MDPCENSFVIVKIKPGTGDIFAYKMYHSFISVQGLFRVLLSAAFLALGLATVGRVSAFLSAAVIGIGILNPVVTPLMFLAQASRASRGLSGVSYTFSAEKIVASDGKRRSEMKWDELALVVWTRRELFIYTTPFEALVLPRGQMEGKDGELLRIIKAAANPDRTVYRKLL